MDSEALTRLSPVPGHLARPLLLRFICFSNLCLHDNLPRLASHLSDLWWGQECEKCPSEDTQRKTGLLQGPNVQLGSK